MKMKVGQFQVSEMLGDDWQWWTQLFVSSVPAKSRVLAHDISTVVTGPRGCGKTMLFRRLSDRRMVECGPITDIEPDFVGLYVNANDIADAFANFPQDPAEQDVKKLVCYAHLCLLSDFLAVLSARVSKLKEEPSAGFLIELGKWIQREGKLPQLLARESRLERYRTELEKLKWDFPAGKERPASFDCFQDLSRHEWLGKFVSLIRKTCLWVDSRRFFIFIDDYTTPRVSESMQRSLNRIFFQRSSQFVCKIATESANTFIAQDSSGKVFQYGDDYRLVDLGEEALFLTDAERLDFLENVFRRRLEKDERVPGGWANLQKILGTSPHSKTAFARLLREPRSSNAVAQPESSGQGKLRKGPAKARALYGGKEVFSLLWSGDTRTMIQIMQDLLDEVRSTSDSNDGPLVEEERQDRVFRSRGGNWLEALTRNQPSSWDLVNKELKVFRKSRPNFNFTAGSYGAHLKAIVEAFVCAARSLLLGPTYKVKENRGIREVPRMAFRIEIMDEFRLGGLETEIYKDLIRYGLFIRDARGKSIRGAMVPRLYLRRFLLPYCVLALSKRDSVSLSCAQFRKLLLDPDDFRREYEISKTSAKGDAVGQLHLWAEKKLPEPQYEDLEDDLP